MLTKKKSYFPDKKKKKTIYYYSLLGLSDAVKKKNRVCGKSSGLL